MAQWLKKKKFTCNAGGASGDAGSILGLGRCPEGGNGSPLQCSFLGNPMDRGAWRVIDHRVAQSRTQLKLLSMPNFSHRHHTMSAPTVGSSLGSKWLPLDHHLQAAYPSISLLYLLNTILMSIAQSCDHTQTSKHFLKSYHHPLFHYPSPLSIIMTISPLIAPPLPPLP